MISPQGSEDQVSALEDFAARLAFPLDDFQRRACERLERGRSVLVAAPTGSGKTTVAEFAVHLARRERDARIFYTTPIKALSNQKFHELCAEYGEPEVGLLTGDVNIRGSAPIVVMTTEVLRNMIYAESEELHDLAFVILDEVHYLADRWRGAVWEEIILHLPESIELVALSATVSNAEELGDWMHAVRGDADVILSERRPVPLYQHVLTERALLPLYIEREGELAERGRLNPELLRLGRGAPDDSHGFRDRGSRNRSARQQHDAYRSHRQRSRGRPPRRHPRISRADIVRALDETDLLPGIVFIFSRNGCDQAVRQCLQAGVRLTDRNERLEIRRIAHDVIDLLDPEDLEILGVQEWLAGLERGVAAHHAGLLPQFKAVVEKLFQRRLIKTVFATETLALGINMPARSVTIERLDKFNGEERLPLTSGEYTQLTGRAGRRGIDHEGHAVVVWRNGLDLEALAHLASARSFPVRSSFRPTPNMVVNLLQRMPRNRARDTLELSFAQFQADHAVVEQARELRAQQESLQGYRDAVERAQGSDRKRWEDRERKLRRQIERGRRRIDARTGTIARTFDRVVELLTDLDYLESDRGEIRVTQDGRMLARVYGERDLLIAECLRSGAWSELRAEDLAALCTAISYDPRRDDEGEDRLPGGAFNAAFARTLETWEHLDVLWRAHRLPSPELGRPHSGIAGAVRGWAAGWSLDRTLEVAGLGAGDFVRWAKQAIDLLDQIAQAEERTGTAASISGTPRRNLAVLARQAKGLIRRGIVETASGT